MPEIVIVDDDASFVSSSAASFTTAPPAFHPSPRQLRRRNTVTQLRRWVSKRMSRSCMVDEAKKSNELSEKNLNDHQRSTLRDGISGIQADEDPIPVQPSSTPIKATSETSDAGISDMEPNGTDNLLHESYVAFCHRFTLSGPPQTKRPFSLMASAMNTTSFEPPTTKEGCSTVTDFILAPCESSEQLLNTLARNQPPTSPAASKDSEISTDQSFMYSNNTSLYKQAPSSRTSLAEERDPKSQTKSFQNFQRPPITWLQPPPQVVTPDLYMEKQRTAREHKRSGTQRLFEPFRWAFTRNDDSGRAHRLGVE